MRDIWLELKRLVERGEQGALVTVVRTEGSAYQREGTKMLFQASGEGVGTISGGCLEADLYEHCRSAIRVGEPQVVTYSPERRGQSSIRSTSRPERRRVYRGPGDAFPRWRLS